MYLLDLNVKWTDPTSAHSVWEDKTRYNSNACNRHTGLLFGFLLHALLLYQVGGHTLFYVDLVVYLCQTQVAESFSLPFLHNYWEFSASECQLTENKLKTQTFCTPVTMLYLRYWDSHQGQVYCPFVYPAEGDRVWLYTASTLQIELPTWASWYCKKYLSAYHQKKKTCKNIWSFIKSCLLYPPYRPWPCLPSLPPSSCYSL